MPTSALAKFTGLAGWLVCYLRTQAGPYSLTYDYLHRYSGSTCGLPEFRRRLRAAVAMLSAPSVDRYLRIDQVYWEPKSVVFMLARWPEKVSAQQLEKARQMQLRYAG